MSRTDRRPRGRLLPALGLRARLTVIGVFGLAAGLAVGGLILLGALGYTLQRTVDTEAFRTADAVALLAAEDALPDPLPVAGGQVRVQVVDAQGRVRAASIDADRLVPMLRPDQFDRGQRQTAVVSGHRLGLPGPVRVVAVPAGTTAEPLTVLVGRSMADARHSVHVVRTLLLVSFPLLVAGIAVVAWRVVGATLRPVEALRSGAVQISGRAGPGRLPVPASRDEIHRLAVTLNDMLDRLESARDRQRAFVADAAHELRSPLANMRTELEVAQRLADRTDWPAVAENLLTDTERLSRLVDDLLLLARLDETGAMLPEVAGESAVPTGHRAREEGPDGGSGAGRSGSGGPEAGEPAGRVPVPRSRRATGPVELGALLASVAGRYPSPPVAVAVPAEPHWTVGDPDELRRVLANLVDNAVRHARSRVLLTVTGPTGAGPGAIGPGVSPAAGSGGSGPAGPGAAAYHLVTVTDDGPGVPVADRERVFHRFTRLDDARARDAGGAGLGLAIVRELVRRTGGLVELTDADAEAGPDVRATDGPGLRVRLLLPALADPKPHPGHPPANPGRTWPPSSGRDIN